MKSDSLPAAVDHAALQSQIEQFLYLEADLLDERRYSEWLDLLADDFTYSMPLRLNVQFGQQESRENTRAGSDVLWMDEGKDTLAQRVEQILTGSHWAEEPLSRVSHLLTNIRFKDISVESAALSCRFLVYRNRVEADTDFLVGRRLDWLRRVGDTWRFARREVLLDQNVLLAKNLTVFI